ncbi:circadian clock protein KaiC [archaeon SCG-AAA382B04]|nr:circadian clock protein KaiC [archaeon SCG-AAA382B04]
MNHKRVKTGVYGLDDILKGGYRKKTINIVMGGTGVGKTTFAFQYSLYGLFRDENVVYISMEMNQKQIIREFEDMGWNEIKEFINKDKFHILQESGGRDSLFLSTTLMDKIRDRLSENKENRIIIDPLTPISFSYDDENKRKEINRFFESLRELGTTLITLEKHTVEEKEKKGVIPLYLADSVIQLQNLGFGELYDRTLKVIKHRGSDHGEGLYPFEIFKGTGIIVETSEEQLEKLKPNTKYCNRFQEAKETIKKEFEGDHKEALLKKVNLLEKNWTSDEDPKKVLNTIIKTEKYNNEN